MREGQKKKDNEQLKTNCNPSVTHGKTEKSIQDDFSCENDGPLSLGTSQSTMPDVTLQGLIPVPSHSLSANPPWPWVWQSSGTDKPQGMLPGTAQG